MILFNIALHQLLNQDQLKIEEKNTQLIELLIKCNGAIFLNEHKKLIFIDTSNPEDYLYHFQGNDALFQKEKDMAAINAILRFFNETLQGDEIIIFYENHLLKQSYRKITKKYGFSKAKCTSSNARIQKKIYQSFALTRSLKEANL